MQARFPDFRFKRVTPRLPNLLEEISGLLAGVTHSPVHSGGNRLGFSPNFPCYPLRVPAFVKSLSMDVDLISRVNVRKNLQPETIWASVTLSLGSLSVKALHISNGF